MQYLAYIIIGALGIWIGRHLAVRRYAGKSEMSQMREKAKIAQKIKSKSIEEKILQFVSKHKKITNDDVEEMFCGIADSTANNYLNDLEKAGKLKQVGKTGRGVFYELP